MIIVIVKFILIQCIELNDKNLKELTNKKGFVITQKSTDKRKKNN